MTGLFVRIIREGSNGPHRPVDIDEMSDAELDALDAPMATREAWQLWTWVKALARWIRHNEGWHARHDPLAERIVTHVVQQIEAATSGSTLPLGALNDTEFNVMWERCVHHVETLLEAGNAGR